VWSGEFRSKELLWRVWSFVQINTRKNSLSSHNIFSKFDSKASREMLVERTNKEIIIRLPASVDIDDLQDFINYARYKEITSKFKIEQSEADTLAEEISEYWWTENRKRRSTRGYGT
jgi:hypothetical protein